jgi:1,4-alpha-glucan branching enzyme
MLTSPISAPYRPRRPDDCMRILSLSRSMPWHLAGGLENHAWDLVRGLAAAGDEIHVLTTPFREGAGKSEPPRNVSIHTIDSGAPGEYSLRTFRALARKAEALHGEFNFDVIHSQGFAAYAFPKRLAERLAVTVHGTLTTETPLYPPVFREQTLGGKIALLWRYKARLASAPLYNRLLKMARVILVDSKFTRNELLHGNRRLENKIRLAPLGIHSDRAPAAPSSRRLPEKPLRFLSVGRLTRAKGMHVALEAMKILPENGWTWRVAGTGPELESLKRQACDAGLANRPEFLGEVDANRLSQLYETSDLFVNPELGYPAFGLVALEAMLAGLPVVASDRGAIPEVVQPDCGWLFPGGDYERLANRLKSLIEHPAHIAEVASRCRNLALERFSFESMVEKTRAALAECAAK